MKSRREPPGTGLTRRHFLTRVAAAGGAPFVYEAMTGLGLLAAPTQAPFDLTGRVSGVRVVVLGAGLAGMTVAYELVKVGFDCRVLEARARPGGRVFTVRRGTVSEEDGPPQTAAFDDGLYFNAGPMRIPDRHRTTLAYCRELQVPVEVFIDRLMGNASPRADADRASLYRARSSTVAGRPLRVREARAGFDRYVVELLSRVSPARLDQPLTAQDRERLDAGAQPTMMQVVGGMDRLPAALAARLGRRIEYRAVVREIRQNDSGVWVAYADADGQLRRVDADYCVSTIPLPVLSGIQKDLSRSVQSAISVSAYDSAGKIGLQFKRRFWEEDDDIFGGRAWTGQEIGQIIYPSHGFQARKGILVGYFLDFKRTMRERTPAERQRAALEQGARTHPQYATEFETAFSVSWPRVPWSRGSWRSETAAAHEALAALRRPDGRVYFAGDYMTSLSSFMQGAFESGREVATAIHTRARAQAR